MRQYLPAPVLAALLLASGLELRAQTTIHAPGGVLTGSVQDSTTGLPVGYALLILVERNHRVFATGAGRFSLSGLSSGPVTLRVQQIGYRGVAIPLVLDTGNAQAATPGVVIFLSRQAFVLPDVVVRSGDCATGEESTVPESGTILDEAFRNAERLLTLQKDYPYRSAMQQVTVILDADRAPVSRKVDTVRYESRESAGYRRGKVLQLIRSRIRGRPTLGEHAIYFEPSDLARPEFRKNHCFWFAGADSVEGFPGYRIDFRPTANLRTPDWAGSLLIDSASMHLLRSEAHLVNLPTSGTNFRAAECTVLYMQLVPTLVHEFSAHCTTAQKARPLVYTVARWRLLEHAFVGRRPDAPDPP